jgi:hypothetical protein
MGAETKDTREVPIKPQITLEMFEQPTHAAFDRYLTFENHAGRRKRLRVLFKKTGALRWEVDRFPEGIDVLESLTDTGNRSYWDHMYLENRGGTTVLPIEKIQIVIRYDDAPGSSATEFPVVDSVVHMELLSGNDEICLDEFARRSRYMWAKLLASDPPVIRMIAQDLGKSGSDGQGDDQYGHNPKYRARTSKLCSEFVSWYYYEADIKVNGKSLANIVETQELHDLFAAEGTLYRYDCNANVQSFVHAETNARYTPKPGDYLERRAENEADHSMIIYRWRPGNPSISAGDYRHYNRAKVFNGPWPVTTRNVFIEKDEVDRGIDYWLGRID